MFEPKGSGTPLTFDAEVVGSMGDRNRGAEFPQKGGAVGEAILGVPCHRVTRSCDWSPDRVSSIRIIMGTVAVETTKRCEAN